MRDRKVARETVVVKVRTLGVFLGGGVVVVPVERRRRPVNL